MYKSHPTLSHQGADVTEAELVSDVPSDGLDDEQMIKVAAFEDCWSIRGRLGHADDYLCSPAFAPEPNFIVRLHYIIKLRKTFSPRVDFPDHPSSIGWKRGEE
jgi:hypothetical protein